MTTRYIPVTTVGFHKEIRIDTDGADTHITVYSLNIKDIDLLIQALEALKAEQVKPVHVINEKGYGLKWDKETNTIKRIDDTDEPPEMTAVLGAKPNVTDWHKSPFASAVKPEPYKYIPPHTAYEPDPPMPQPHKGIHTINVIGVESKKYKNYGGTKNPDMNADIIKGESIRIYGLSDKRVKYNRETRVNTYYKEAFDRTFKIGDTAEYGSYNMKYTGKIVAIGEKTVKIDDGYGGTRMTQLSLQEFINRNWNLNLNKIAEDNANWSMTS